METREPLAKIPYLLINSLKNFNNIYEIRLFGWILAKSQSVIRYYNSDLSEINVERALNLVRITFPARYLLPETDNDYTHIYKAFNLAERTIPYKKNNYWYNLNIIAFPQVEKVGKQLMFSCVIHNELWHVLLDFQQRYRLVNLYTYMKLSNQSSVIMYILISQQNEAITFRIDDLRELLGANGGSYSRYNNFLARYLRPAQKELMEKAPYSFEIEELRSGRGNAVKGVKIVPKAVSKMEEESEKNELKTLLSVQRFNVDVRVVEYLMHKCNLSERQIDVIEPYLAQHGNSQQQIEKIEYIMHKAKKGNIHNLHGYLYAALRG